jgi:hypothetical protein
MKRFFLTALLALLAAGTPASADTGASPALQGPIRLRDLSPFSLQRLDFQPASALAEVPEQWTLELNLSQTNTFVMSENVADYLQARGSRQPLTAADARALAALGEDYYYFDGAITVLHVTGHYALDRNTAVYAIVPVQWHNGGFLDAGIESFHHSLGLTNANREYVTRNGYTALLRLEGETLRYLDSPGAGIGDPVAGLRYRGLTLGDWRVVLEAAVTLPVGTVDEFFSNGAADGGIQVSLQRQRGAHGIYVSLNQVWVGRPDRLADSIRRRVPSLTLAYEYALDPASSLIGQFTLARSSFARGPDAGLTENEYQASIGWRRSWPDGRHLTLAFTENLFAFNNTPDIGLHVGFGWNY